MTSDELTALAASMPFAKLIGFDVIEAGKDKVVPFLLETELRGLGARFEGGKPFERYVCREGRLVTGQNPASAEGVAHGMLMALHALKQKAAE